MAENNSAAAMAAATAPMKVENLSMPGFGPKGGNTNFDPLKYRVRYGKYDMDDMGAIAELEIIETKGLAATEIVVLNKDKYTFLEKYFLVVTYLELITEA